MKIASYEASILLVPEDDPLANMPEEAGRMRPIVILRLRTDSGIEGIGLTFYGARITRALHAAVEDLAALTVGEDPMRIEHIVAKLRRGLTHDQAQRAARILVEKGFVEMKTQMALPGDPPPGP